MRSLRDRKGINQKEKNVARWKDDRGLPAQPVLFSDPAASKLAVPQAERRLIHHAQQLRLGLGWIRPLPLR